MSEFQFIKTITLPSSIQDRMITRVIDTLFTIVIRAIKCRYHLRTIDIVIHMEDFMIRLQLNNFSVGKNL